ncbi:hypothetical protein TRFO_07594 [Tritrichomonas foetus]|uniref:BTB domain-containing protein n=1 Tax=Tritrichomonas foetus TaxID=1144522 RepID=A0A1J4JV06_9EUKA|nr:hypothetical protein TRFO_07594 [Tritrichomonas foetus]|eukprot:OHT01356.1 hypothetical protein TRFO_07594 [Tritrichomonas foetus]
MNDFPLVYNGKQYNVDPAFFAIYSIKFREIFNPAYAEFSQVTILGNYQDKSVEIFSLLCQGREVNIPDMNMKDIASLAKVFNAEEILETCVRIIHSRIDGSFRPDERGTIVYENRGSTTATESFEKQHEKGFFKSMVSSSSQNSLKTMTSSNSKSDLKSAVKEEVQTASSQQSTVSDTPKYYLEKPIVYEIQSEKKKLMKAPKYLLTLNGNVLAAGKTKSSVIVINNGTDVHFETIESSAAEIQRQGSVNTIRSEGSYYTLKYYRDSDTNFMTMHGTFKIDDSEVLLTGLKNAPKDEPFLASRQVVTDRHPCILYLKNGKTAMIVSKTDGGSFTFHNFVKMPHILAFAIALSAIAGAEGS